jgi:hypothetical protein
MGCLKVRTRFGLTDRTLSFESLSNLGQTAMSDDYMDDYIDEVD